MGVSRRWDLSTWKIVDGTCIKGFLNKDLQKVCSHMWGHIQSLSQYMVVLSSCNFLYVSLVGVPNRQTTYLQAWKTICSFSPKIGACGDGSGLQTVVLDVLTLNLHQFRWHHSSKMHWTDINRRLELSIKSPCLWASFDLHPVFYWYPQSKEIWLKLRMKCWNLAFNAQGSRVIIIVVQVGA
jgi:hypothetical protein